MGAVGSIIDSTEAATLSFAQNVWTEFDTVAQTPVLVVATIALMITGYLLLTGQLSLQASQFFPRLFRWFVVVTLLLNMPLLLDYVYPLVTAVPEAIAQFLVAQTAAGSTSGAIGMIESVYGAGFEAAAQVWNKSGVLDFSSHVISGLLLVTALALAVVASVLLILSKLATGILLAVGPFFFLLRLFDSGKGLFEGWLRQLLSFAVIPIFVYSLIGLNFTILTAGHTQLTASTALGEPTLQAVVQFGLVAIVNLVLLTQVVTWAGGVGGGIALAVSAGGIISGASTAARVASGAARVTQRAYTAGAPVAVAAAAAAGRNVMKNVSRGSGF